jgi:hypothetical protein
MKCRVCFIVTYLSFCSTVQGELPFSWDGIQVTGFQVISDNGGRPNSLSTFMNQRNFELSRGLDFNRSGIQGALQAACVHHLDHVGFTYHIDVVSLSSSLLKLLTRLCCVNKKRLYRLNSDKMC